MRKFLALVLALVMTMSLVTISAGAEDFTDADSVTYEEAVEVMTAAGVVGGYADGSFNPTAGLTRGAAAKIICNMILGPTTAEALSANDAPYSDVAVDNVFAGYIAYCANEGIISGYADGTFRPAAPLTGYAFMKMLLGALGYDADIEGYTGANWSIQVAKRALNVGLDNDLEGTFVGAKALTREEACLYAFNTMKADMVSYDSKSTITVGDIVITQNADAKVVTDDQKNENNIWEDDNALQFAEKYFKDLEVVTADVRDDFGRPAHTWKWDGDKVGTYTDTADYVVVVDDVYDQDDLVEFVLDNTDEELDADAFFGNSAKKIYHNGDKADAATKIAALAKPGAVIELFCNDSENDDLVTDVVTYTYDILVIDSVSEKVGATAAKEGAEYAIKLETVEEASAGTFYDEYEDEVKKVLAGFDAETYVEGAYIAVVKGSDKGIIYSCVADTVSGVVESYKQNEWVKLDGTKYPMNLAANIPTLGFEDEYTLYLSPDGLVLYIEGDTGTSIEDVYYITMTYEDTTSKGDTTYYAETVSLKGEVADVVISEAAYDELGRSVQDLYVLDLNKDDQYEVEEYTNDTDEDYDIYTAEQFAEDIKASDSSVDLGAVKVYLEDDTQYVAIKLKEGKDVVKSVSVAEGGKSYSKNNAGTVIALYDDNKDAAYVLYIGEAVASTADTDDIVFVTGESKTTTDEGVYEAAVWYMGDLAGGETTMDVEGTPVEAGFYSFTTNEDNWYELDGEDRFTGKVEEDTTGWAYINITKDAIHNTTVTFDGATKYEDIEFGAATVIDLRDADVIDDSDIYNMEITSAADVVDAAETETVGTINAFVYIVDGEITFMAVKTVGAAQ